MEIIQFQINKLSNIQFDYWIIGSIGLFRPLWIECGILLRWTDRYTRSDCSIRKPPDRWSMAHPRRLSWPYTSFLGMSALGIHYQLVALQRTKGFFVPFSKNFSKKILAEGSSHSPSGREYPINK